MIDYANKHQAAAGLKIGAKEFLRLENIAAVAMTAVAADYAVDHGVDAGNAAVAADGVARKHYAGRVTASKLDAAISAVLRGENAIKYGVAIDLIHRALRAITSRCPDMIPGDAAYAAVCKSQFPFGFAGDSGAVTQYY